MSRPPELNTTNKSHAEISYVNAGSASPHTAKHLNSRRALLSPRGALLLWVLQSSHGSQLPKQQTPTSPFARRAASSPRLNRFILCRLVTVFQLNRTERWVRKKVRQYWHIFSVLLIFITLLRHWTVGRTGLTGASHHAERFGQVIVLYFCLRLYIFSCLATMNDL